jgi:hypothetical protein
MESIGERAFLGCTDLLGTYDSNDGYENKKVSFNSIDNVYYLRNDDIYYCLGKYDNFEYSEIIPTPSGNIDIISGKTQHLFVCLEIRARHGKYVLLGKRPKFCRTFFLPDSFKKVS